MAHSAVKPLPVESVHTPSTTLTVSFVAILATHSHVFHEAILENKQYRPRAPMLDELDMGLVLHVADAVVFMHKIGHSALLDMPAHTISRNHTAHDTYLMSRFSGSMTSATRSVAMNMLQWRLDLDWGITHDEPSFPRVISNLPALFEPSRVPSHPHTKTSTLLTPSVLRTAHSCM